MIRVQGLCKEFDDPRSGIFRALDHVSFEVRPGKSTGCSGRTEPANHLPANPQHRPSANRGIAEVDGINVVRDPEGVRSRMASCHATPASTTA